MRDLRAFVRWLSKEDLIDRPIEVPVPKVPQHLFSILSNDEMPRVWQSTYMTGRSSMAIRNRALIGLMLDTGLGAASSRLMSTINRRSSSSSNSTPIKPRSLPPAVGRDRPSALAP